MAQPKPQIDPPRTHVTLEYNGKEPVQLPTVLLDGKRVRVTLKPGRTTVLVEYFHAIGGDSAANELIATGAIKPVCLDHIFRRGDGSAYRPIFLGNREVGCACRYCGVQEDPPVAELPVTHEAPQP